MDVLCIHCSSPHSADWDQHELPAVSVLILDPNHGRGAKSEAVALMYWLATLIYNNNNMHAHSSQKKCSLLSQMLPFMLQIHYQTLCWRISLINILIMPLVVVKCVLIDCFILVIGASPVMPNQKFRIYIYVHSQLKIYINSQILLYLENSTFQRQIFQKRSGSLWINAFHHN